MKIQCLTNLRDGCRSSLLLIALSLLSGCSDFGVSVGDFPTEQLLLSAAAFPVGWETSGPPRSLGPSNAGYGDEEDDRSIGFVFALGDEPEYASQEIMQFRREDKAVPWYTSSRTSLLATFEDQVGLDEEEDAQLRYDGILAHGHENDYALACTIRRSPRPRRCAFIARYDRFIVEFNSVVRPGVMTIEQFNAIVAEIDQIMVDNLNLSVEQDE